MKNNDAGSGVGDDKECFIITPIGGATSVIRRETDGLIKTVFSPILKKNGFKAVAAHQISETGSITKQVIKRIIEADLVIANLTELNPNVMYELGIRHCARKPVIVVARDDVNLPFDLSDERTIFYKNDMFGVEELQASLEAMIPISLADSEPDNPVYRVVDYDLIRYSEAPTDIDKVMDMRLSKIEDRLVEIARQGRMHGLDTISSLYPKGIYSTILVNKKDANRAVSILKDMSLIVEAESPELVKGRPLTIKVFNLPNSDVDRVEELLKSNGIETFPF